MHRRRFLHGVAGAVGVAGLTALAGCSSSCPDSGSPTPESIVALDDAPTGPFEDAPGGRWPDVHGGPANAGYVDASLPDALAVRWRTDLPLPNGDAASLSASSPTVGNDRVLVADRESVHALDLATGERLWHRTGLAVTAVEQYRASLAETPAPTAPGGRVFVGTTDGIVALTALDGNVDWRGTGLQDATAPLVHGDLIVGVGRETVAAFDPHGREQWRVSRSRQDPPFDPATDAERVVLATDRAVVALDAASGEERWRYDERPESYPVLVDGECVVGVSDGLIGLDAATGAVRWRFTRGDYLALQSPVVTPTSIYAVEQPPEAGAAAFALDRTDGEPSPRWCSSVGSAVVAAATPEHAVAMVPLGEGPDAVHSLVAFTADLGDAAWGLRGGGYPRSWPTTPAVLDGGVVATTRGGTVVALGRGD